MEPYHITRKNINDISLNLGDNIFLVYYEYDWGENFQLYCVVSESSPKDWQDAANHKGALEKQEQQKAYTILGVINQDAYLDQVELTKIIESLLQLEDCSMPKLGPRLIELTWNQVIMPYSYYLKMLERK
jgi:hypothetical protein